MTEEGHTSALWSWPLCMPALAPAAKCRGTSSRPLWHVQLTPRLHHANSLHRAPSVPRGAPRTHPSFPAARSSWLLPALPCNPSHRQKNTPVVPQVRTRTNRSGGVQGGLSNGEDIVIRVAFKPTSTIGQKQKTVGAHVWWGWGWGLRAERAEGVHLDTCWGCLQCLLRG